MMDKMAQIEIVLIGLVITDDTALMINACMVYCVYLDHTDALFSSA